MSNPEPPKTNPADADFGRSAQEKEEKLDQALETGQDIPADESDGQQPRAGSKADPDQS